MTEVVSSAYLSSWLWKPRSLLINCEMIMSNGVWKRFIHKDHKVELIRVTDRKPGQLLCFVLSYLIYRTSLTFKARSMYYLAQVSCLSVLHHLILPLPSAPQARTCHRNIACSSIIIKFAPTNPENPDNKINLYSFYV